MSGASDAGAIAKAGSGGIAGSGGSGRPSDDATWTTMGGDARNNYHNPNETKLNVGNAKDLKQKWVFEVAGFPPGSPVIAEGKVFVMATGGTYAIDLEKGTEVWKRMDVAGTASVAYADGFVYLHDASAQLYKLKASDGTTVWGPVRTYELATCDGTSSPVVALDKVIVGHSCGVAEVTGNPDQDVARGGVEAFAIADGTRSWTYFTAAETGENGAMVWSTVGVDVEAKVVFATTGNNYTLLGENSDSIHAIDLTTGKRVWKKQVREGDVWSLGSKTGFMAPTGPSIDTDFGANPILADVDGKKLVAAGDKASTFWVLDRATGEIVWSRAELSAAHSPANGGVLNNGAFDGQYFYAASNEPPMDSLLHVLDAKDGHDVVEPVRLGAIAWGALSLANGVLFVPVNSVLKVFNAKTLELLTSFDTGGTIAAGAAAVVDGNVVVGSGLMYQFARDALPNNKIICYALDATGTATTSGGMVASGASTWSAVYSEVIVGTGCSGSSMCHGGDVGVGSLSLQTKDGAYKALVGVKAMGSNLGGMGTHCKDLDIQRVVAGDPAASLLVQKLEGTQTCGDSMPPGGLKLKNAQLQQVRAWVQNGAKDD